MDLSASEMETELVDLSAETLASLGMLSTDDILAMARGLLDVVDNPPTLSDASSNCYAPLWEIPSHLVEP